MTVGICCDDDAHGMALESVGAWQSRTIPLPEGEAGTAKTIRLIQHLVEEGVKNPRVRRTAVDILQSVPAYNEDAEVSAIYHWVLQNIRYTKDMLGVGHGIETLQPAADILITRAGDCDDINAILLPSLLGSVGYETRAVTIKADPSDPANFSHIFIEVLANGRWIPLDAARPDAAFARAPEVFWQARRWGLTGGGGMLNGLGCPHMECSPRVTPRWGLGDWTDILTKIPEITSGTSQIILASKGIPYSSYQAFPYATGYPGQFYGQAPGAYVAGGGTGMWILIALGVGALILLSRR